MEGDIIAYIGISLISSLIIFELKKKINIPEAPLLLLVGFISRIFGEFTDKIFNVPDVISHRLILMVFMPPLIFGTALETDWYTFRREFFYISILVSSVVILQTGLTAGITKEILLLDISWPEAFLLGSILSATDHVAVLPQLRESNTSEKFETLLKGETLLNEGVVLVIFQIMLEYSTNSEPEFSDLAFEFFYLFGGGLILGLFSGWIMTHSEKYIINDDFQEMNLIIIIVYLVFYLAEGSGLNLSGGIALVVLGLYISAYGETVISRSAESKVKFVWKFLERNIEILIYVIGGGLLGMLAFYTERIGVEDLLKVLGLYVLLQLIRGLVVAVHFPLFRCRGYKMTVKEGVILTLGGSKGAINIVLVLILYSNSDLSYDIRSFFLFQIIGITALSIIFNTLAVKYAALYLGLSSISETQIFMIFKFLSNLTKKIEKKIEKLENDPQNYLADFKEIHIAAGPHLIIEKALKLYSLPLKAHTQSGKIHPSDLGGARNFYGTGIQVEETIIELRRRILTTLKVIYWEKFEKTECSGDTTLMLINSANSSLESINEPLDDWNSLRDCLFSKLDNCFPFIFKNERLGKFIKKIMYMKVVKAYESSKNFWIAHEEINRVLENLGSNMTEEAIDKVKEENDTQIKECKNFISQYIEKTFPEILTVVGTYQLSYKLLNIERKELIQMHKQGHITSNDCRKLLNFIDKRIGNLSFKSLIQVPSLRQLLLTRFRDAYESDIDDLLTLIEPRIYEPGQVIYEKHQALGGGVIIIKGTAIEKGKDWKQEEGIGALLCPYMLTPQYEFTVSQARAKSLVLAADIPRDLIENFPSTQEQIWRSAAYYIIKIHSRIFEGELDGFSPFDIKKLVSLCDFLEFEEGDLIDPVQGGVLLLGSIEGVIWPAVILPSTAKWTECYEKTIFFEFPPALSKELLLSPIQEAIATFLYGKKKKTRLFELPNSALDTLNNLVKEAVKKKPRVQSQKEIGIQVDTEEESPMTKYRTEKKEKILLRLSGKIKFEPDLVLEMERVNEGMEWIRVNLIEKIIEYFDGGRFNKPTNDIYIKGYNLVYEISDISDLGKPVYDFYVNTIKNYTRQKAKSELIRPRGEELLRELEKRWKYHIILVYWMSKTFTYLDRYYVRNSESLMLAEAGMKVFKDEIFDEIKESICTALIHEINREREGYLINVEMVKECIICLAEIGLSKTVIRKGQVNNIDSLLLSGTTDLKNYEQYFEQKFLNDSSVYYTEKSANWLSILSCPEYLREAKQAIESEEARADRYLEANTKEKLVTITVQELVVLHSHKLAEMPGTGCKEMFRQDKRDELKLMFSIFKRNEGSLSDITSKMGPYIEERGTALVSDQNLQKDAIAFTKALLAFKENIDSLVQYSFDSHHLFERCRDEAFENFLNKCQFSAAFIASYCDNEMKKGLRGVSESEVEARLDALIKLFVCLHDRDIFIKHYTRYLAKRLLDTTSISDDAENTMVAKLKVECGHNIVSKILNMNEDISLSSTMMNEFRDLSHGGVIGGVSLNVRVLRNGCWPEESSEVCSIPRELHDGAERFKEFYMNKHSGRNLTWLMGQGYVEVTTTFTERNYIMTMNPYEAALLLMFNSGEIFTISDMKEETKLTEKTLKANIIMFFNPKFKLLNKQSRGKTLNDNEPIRVNLDFQSGPIRIDYRPKKVKKAETTTQEDEIAINAERRNILDSVIVRIAKTRKLIRHQDLINEVIRQVQQFKPQPPMIKGQVESLIQREFLARDENDRGLYHYIPELILANTNMEQTFEEGMGWLEANYIEKILRYLDKGEVFTMNNRIFRQGYDIVYKLSDEGDWKKLYEHYVDTVKNYTVGYIEEGLMWRKGCEFIKEYVKRWKAHKILVYWMSRIYLYLDREYLSGTKLGSLTQIGIDIFYTEVFGKVREKLAEAVMEEIEAERENEVVDEEGLKEAILSFIQAGLSNTKILKVENYGSQALILEGKKNLNFYLRDIEKKLLETTTRFYERKAHELAETLSSFEYLVEVKKVFQREEERVTRYLEPSTKQKIFPILIQHLIVDKSKIISQNPDSGAFIMFQEDKKEQLKLMFNLFRKSEPSLHDISEQMYIYLEIEGKKIINNPSFEKEILAHTEELLKFKQKIDFLIDFCFKNHPIFLQSRNLSFKHFLNSNSKSAGYIASYCDLEMKKGLRGVTEEEANFRLDNLVFLIVHLYDRDIFLKYYTKFLSKRLLNNTSVSDDAEKLMIAKIKVECGHNIVSKIFNMMQDMELSVTLNANFKELSHRGIVDGVEINVKVLKNGSWPEELSEACVIPDDLLNSSKKYSEFYLNSYEGRQLKWLMGEGNVEIALNFTEKNYVLVVNPYEAALILMFNEASSYCLTDLQEKTRLSIKTLKENFIMFFNPKYRILLKKSKGKNFNEDEIFWVNEGFKSANLRVDYRPSKNVKNIESSEDSEAIESERKNIIDSVIVRIAKGRKVVKHSELMSEVIEQIEQFVPEPPMIKGQIENLIQREFLRRDDDDRALYHYIP